MISYLHFINEDRSDAKPAPPSDDSSAGYIHTGTNMSPFADYTFVIDNGTIVNDCVSADGASGKEDLP